MIDGTITWKTRRSESEHGKQREFFSSFSSSSSLRSSRSSSTFTRRSVSSSPRPLMTITIMSSNSNNSNNSNSSDSAPIDHRDFPNLNLISPFSLTSFTLQHLGLVHSIALYNGDPKFYTDIQRYLDSQRQDDHRSRISQDDHRKFIERVILIGAKSKEELAAMRCPPSVLVFQYHHGVSDFARAISLWEEAARSTEAIDPILRMWWIGKNISIFRARSTKTDAR
ncbi:unnamed protein product, partial [Mesorhabditis belari]|uniref:Uncharacterized protein n=1 Tax=Mesorhabditis belari TaxID=2138241 RepID=A0AAF3FRH5_9BILA